MISRVVAPSGALIAAMARDPFIFIVAVSLLHMNNTIYQPTSYSFTTRLFEPKDRPKGLGIHRGLGHRLGPPPTRREC